MRHFRLVATGLASLALVAAFLPYCPCPEQVVGAAADHDCCAAGLRSADAQSCCPQAVTSDPAAKTPELSIACPSPSQLAMKGPRVMEHDPIVRLPEISAFSSSPPVLRI